MLTQDIESKWQDFWEKSGIYKFDRDDQTTPVFSIDTPPPYISSTHLHAGHAMSFTQADIVVRYMRMMGYNIFYPMGFDDNGLPTERFVERQYKIDQKKISKHDFVKMCLEETSKQSLVYQRLFKKLGISVDWSLGYSTIDPHCRKTAQLSFIDLYHKGLVEHKQGPVIWCPFCNTALALTDLEEKELPSHLHTITFGDEAGMPIQIATTRPELLAACVALYVNSADERYRNLIGAKATVPLFGHEVPIIADDLVDMTFGTGSMMVCTWGDAEDVRRWLEDRLDKREILTRDGLIDEAIPYIGGLRIKEARHEICALLEQGGHLIASEPLNHDVKVHERCNTPVEFIVATQWFIKIADSIDEWRRRGNELEWYPQFMKSKYDAWIEGLKWDWCISRQRYYGVPFPVWYCDECGKTLLPGISQLPVDPSEDPCPIEQCECGSSKMSPELDVMDTWMTSSITPLINCHWQEEGSAELMNKIYPMTLRVQAFEIIRTWLFYTIVKSHFHTGSLPWQKAMISGWGLDSKGKKISKSSGNSANAEVLIDRYSADALRFWASDSELGHDHRFREEELQAGRRLVIKLTNAARFASKYLSDYTPEDPMNTRLEDSDKWILMRLNDTLKEYHSILQGFEYSKARRAVDKLFWSVFCDNYLEFIKHRLNRTDPDEGSRAALATLYKVLLAIIQMYAPFVPFVAEEAYQSLFANREGCLSVHTSRSPVYQEGLNLEISGNFEGSLDAVALIRKYRSQTGLSFRTQIATVWFETESGTAIDTEFVATTMNVGEILPRSVDEPTVSSNKLKLHIAS